MRVLSILYVSAWALRLVRSSRFEIVYVVNPSSGAYNQDLATLVGLKTLADSVSTLITNDTLSLVQRKPFQHGFCHSVIDIPQSNSKLDFRALPSPMSTSFSSLFPFSQSPLSKNLIVGVAPSIPRHHLTWDSPLFPSESCHSSLVLGNFVDFVRKNDVEVVLIASAKDVPLYTTLASELLMPVHFLLLEQNAQPHQKQLFHTAWLQLLQRLQHQNSRDKTYLFSYHFRHPSSIIENALAAEQGQTRPSHGGSPTHSVASAFQSWNHRRVRYLPTERPSFQENDLVETDILDELVTDSDVADVRLEAENMAGDMSPDFVASKRQLLMASEDMALTDDALFSSFASRSSAGSSSKSGKTSKKTTKKTKAAKKSSTKVNADKGSGVTQAYFAAIKKPSKALKSKKSSTAKATTAKTTKKKSSSKKIGSAIGKAAELINASAQIAVPLINLKTTTVRPTPPPPPPPPSPLYFTSGFVHSLGNVSLYVGLIVTVVLAFC